MQFALDVCVCCCSCENPGFKLFSKRVKRFPPITTVSTIHYTRHTTILHFTTELSQVQRLYIKPWVATSIWKNYGVTSKVMPCVSYSVCTYILWRCLFGMLKLVVLKVVSTRVGIQYIYTALPIFLFRIVHSYLRMYLIYFYPFEMKQSRLGISSTPQYLDRQPSRPYR